VTASGELWVFAGCRAVIAPSLAAATSSTTINLCQPLTSVSRNSSIAESLVPQVLKRLLVCWTNQFEKSEGSRLKFAPPNYKAIVVWIESKSWPAYSSPNMRKLVAPLTQHLLGTNNSKFSSRNFSEMYSFFRKHGQKSKNTAFGVCQKTSNYLTQKGLQRRDETEKQLG
jgi:hypothetical protein